VYVEKLASDEGDDVAWRRAKGFIDECAKTRRELFDDNGQWVGPTKEQP